MTTPRFFIPPEWIQDSQVTLSGDFAHQVYNVLRLQAGDHIVVLDDTGWECEVELTAVERDAVSGRVVEERQSTGEPGTRISLYQSVLKARKFEWVLQKGTELGIVEFIPIICERSVVGDVAEIDNKQERWRRIIREAAEQSRRGRLPVLHSTMMFSQACQRAINAGGMTAILYEQERIVGLKQALATSLGKASIGTISLFVGPEGGFTPDEVYLASQYGLRAISLGPRILRAETAGLAAATAILYETET
jgi:16S rRNA (uracil1498-N3)-methyltransferase